LNRDGQQCPGQSIGDGVTRAVVKATTRRDFAAHQVRPTWTTSDRQNLEGEAETMDVEVQSAVGVGGELEVMRTAGFSERSAEAGWFLDGLLPSTRTQDSERRGRQSLAS